MKVLQFLATVVSISKRDENCVVGLANDPMNPTSYLILQRSRATDQDLLLGQDLYHLEISNDIWSGYGGVRAATLGRDQLKLALYESDQEVIVGFNIAHDDWDGLQNGLGYIFAGSQAKVLVEI